MIFHTNRKKVNPLQLIIDDTILERVHKFNFLGLTLNEHLNWNTPFNKISNKVSKSMRILNKLKHFLPLNIKILIYYSLILSHLNFGILAWGYQCAWITKLQKKVIRIISLAINNAHTELIFKELKLLKVEDILRLQELKFYYKFKNNKLPHYLKALPIHFNTDIHHHETRTQNNIHPMKTKHECAKKCISCNLPKIINKTPSYNFRKNSYT